MIAFIKNIAPLTLYSIGIIFFLLAMAGKVRWALLLVAFLLPLRNVVDRIQEFPLGSQFIDLLIIAMLFGWLASSFSSGKKIFESSPFNPVILILMGYTLISLLWGGHYLRVGEFFDISDPRIQDGKNYCLLPLLYWITLNNVRDKKWVWRIFAVTCLSMVIMNYYTANQIRWFSSIYSRLKIHGTFQFLGPNEVAAFYNQYSLLLLSVYFFMKKGIPKILLLILILANLYCMVFMYSRAAYLAVSLGMFFLFSVKNRKLLIPLLLVIIYWHMFLPEIARQRILETRDEYGELEISAEQRVIVWRQALEIFQNAPLAGIGFGSFRHLRLILGDTHNIYIKILVEQGLLGILIFFGLIIVFFWEGLRLYQKGEDDLSKGLGLGLMACIVVLLVNNFFGDRWSYLELSAYLWIYAGLVSRLNRLPAESTLPEASSRSKKKLKPMKSM